MAIENQVTFAEVGNPKRVTHLTENTDAAGAYFLTEKVGESAAKKTSYATVESAVKSKVQGEYLQALSATPASDKTMSEKLAVGELKKRDDKIVQLEQDVNKSIFVKTGVYILGDNGNEAINQSYSCTDFVFVKNKTIIAKGLYSKYGVSAYSFYDINKNFLSSNTIGVGGTNVDATITPSDMPASTFYMRFSKINTATSIVTVYPIDSYSEDVRNMVYMEDCNIVATYCDANGVINKADVIWSDNTKGVVTYSDYDDINGIYKSYTISHSSGIKAHQPSVTIVNGIITNIPNIQII